MIFVECRVGLADSQNFPGVMPLASLEAVSNALPDSYMAEYGWRVEADSYEEAVRAIATAKEIDRRKRQDAEILGRRLYAETGGLVP